MFSNGYPTNARLILVVCCRMITLRSPDRVEAGGAVRAGPAKVAIGFAKRSAQTKVNARSAALPVIRADQALLRVSAGAVEPVSIWVIHPATARPIISGWSSCRKCAPLPR